MHLGYIKLVILKILFILGLCNLKFSFKVLWPCPLPPLSQTGGGGACHIFILSTSPSAHQFIMFYHYPSKFLKLRNTRKAVCALAKLIHSNRSILKRFSAILWILFGAWESMFAHNLVILTLSYLFASNFVINQLPSTFSDHLNEWKFWINPLRTQLQILH